MIRIIPIFLIISILSANIEFKTTSNFPDYNELGELDKTLKRFLETNGDFNKLNKKVVKFDDIEFKKNRIIVNGHVYYCGDFIHSNSSSTNRYIKDAFHKNILVEIYSIYNVVYSIQSFRDSKFVLSMNDLYWDKNSKDGSRIRAIRNAKEAPIDATGNLSLIDKFSLNKHYTYPAIPAVLSIVFYAISKDKFNKYNNADNSVDANRYHLETLKYRRYAAYSGAISIGIAIPLNFGNKIRTSLTKFWNGS